MSEVIFKCDGCSKSLCAGDGYIGRSFNCPTCGNKVTLPAPDFLFNCPSCSCELSSQANMSGELFDCPTCGKEFTIPASSQPSPANPVQDNISITCPSCATELEMEKSHHKSMEGQAIDCPACNAAIAIPLPAAQKRAIILPPQKPATPQCPGCKTEMAGNAVICTACGLDLRTGQKLSLEPEKKSRLSFKQQEPAPVEQLNPMLARYKMPEVKVPTFFEKIMPALKTVALLVVIAISIFAFIEFVDVPALLTKIKSLASGETPGKKTEQAAKIAPAVQVPSAAKLSGPVEQAKRPDTKVTSEIILSLQDLRSKPADKAALQDLMDKIMEITDSNENRLIKSGMKTVFAFGQFQTGNEQVGLSCCSHILKNYPDLEFASMVNKVNFYMSCPKCASQGEVHNPCTTCAGNAKCRTCGGDGLVQVTKTVASSGLGSRSAGMGSSAYERHHYYNYGYYTTGKSMAPARRMGDPLATETKTMAVPCSACKGTGGCPTCKGAGFLGAKCTTCNSTGKLLSSEKAAVQYSTAITRTLSLLEQRQQQGKDIEIIETAKLDDKEKAPAEGTTKEAPGSAAEQK